MAIIQWFRFIFLVGGGSFFSTAGGAQAASGIQATALALIPAGLTPVAFFAPNPVTQSLPATSVIFLEALLKKRRGIF